jgi:hypothetical protein
VKRKKLWCFYRLQSVADVESFEEYLRTNEELCMTKNLPFLFPWMHCAQRLSCLVYIFRGEPKCWYGVPGSAANAFEQVALRIIFINVFQNNFVNYRKQSVLTLSHSNSIQRLCEMLCRICLTHNLISSSSLSPC